MKQLKKLGFGLMRLPKVEGADPNSETINPIDVEQTKEMVDLFMDAGFTYFDTAWAYDWSEYTMRKALVERYPRESYTVATKLAAWIDCETREDAIAQFESSLELTQAGYFDYYLLHNLGGPRTEFFDRFDLWSFVQEKKEQGLIKNVGFSFHSTPEELEELLIRHPEVDFVQLQINYADWESSAVTSRANYELCVKYGKPVVVMEPVKGGLLANPPESVAKVLKQADPEASCASWAIRFAASLEGVMMVLSGMSNVEQMKDNISFMKDFQPLNEKETEVINRAREELDRLPVVPCTNCNYCGKVCPQNVGIPGTFEALNLATLFGDVKFAAGKEGFLVRGHGKARANECIQCGLCEEACPQNIPIREELKKAVEVFGM